MHLDSQQAHFGHFIAGPARQTFIPRQSAAPVVQLLAGNYEICMSALTISAPCLFKTSAREFLGARALCPLCLHTERAPEETSQRSSA